MIEKIITFDEIAAILRISAYNNDIKDDSNVIRSWQSLQTSFPSIKFVEDQFSYINPYNQKITSISGLIGTSFFKASEHITLKFDIVRNNVNYLLNKKQYIERITGDAYIQQYVVKLRSAIQKRQFNRRYSHAIFCDASDKICGRYKINANFDLVISNDPIDIFTKSTGRSWERESCERVGGQFDAGIFSDIEWCNLIALLFKSRNATNAIGRVMIRTCKTENGKPSFGIEPIWYTAYGKKGGSDYGNIFGGTSVGTLEGTIKSIITEKGFEIDYETCETPYEYAGYSDNEQDGNVKIIYGESTAPSIDDILDLCTDREAAQCPFCDTLNDWSVDFDARHTNAEQIEKVFAGRDGDIIDTYYIHNVGIEEIGDDYYVADGEPSDDDRCAECGALMFRYNHDGKEKEKFKKLIPEVKNTTETGRKFRPRHIFFKDYDKITQTRIISRAVKDFKEYILSEIADYKYLLAKLKASKKEHDFIEYMLIAELEKEERNEKKRKRHVKSVVLPHQDYEEIGIKIENWINYGDNADEYDADEICIYTRSDLMDFDDIVEKYATARFPEIQREQLLIKTRKPSASKFKKLEKFCRR